MICCRDINNISEIGAVRQGLALAWEMGFKHVKLEIDSNIVLQWLTKVGVYALDIAPLIYDYRNFYINSRLD